MAVTMDGHEVQVGDVMLNIDTGEEVRVTEILSGRGSVCVIGDQLPGDRPVHPDWIRRRYQFIRSST